MTVTRQHQHCSVILVLIRTIGHGTLQKIWVGTFPVQPRGDFELILMVKTETKHPVEGQFGSEFPAITAEL